MTEIDNEAVEAVARAIYSDNPEDWDDAKRIVNGTFGGEGFMRNYPISLRKTREAMDGARENARRAIAAMPGWRTIGTFPRDGNDFLACNDKVLGGDQIVVAFDDDGDRFRCLITADGPSYSPGHFTHWRPLPTPPKPEGS